MPELQQEILDLTDLQVRLEAEEHMTRVEREIAAKARFDAAMVVYNQERQKWLAVETRIDEAHKRNLEEYNRQAVVYNDILAAQAVIMRDFEHAYGVFEFHAMLAPVPPASEQALAEPGAAGLVLVGLQLIHVEVALRDQRGVCVCGRPNCHRGP